MSRILLIDDEESIVNVLTISLKGDGHTVVHALNGNEGVKVFKRNLPDIVITDLKMPGISGLEVLKKIKEIDEQSEVIILTGHGDLDSAIEALQLGASDFINKPIRDDALTIAIERAQKKIDIRLKLKKYNEDLEMMVNLATEELRRKTEFQGKLISSSHDGIIGADENGVIVTYNPAAERIFGYNRIETIDNMNIKDLIPVEFASVFCDEPGNKCIIKDLKLHEITITAKNGERIPAVLSGSMLYDKGRRIGSVAFFQDIRKIKKLELELVKSARLAAIGETVAGLAHYIKNILVGLKGGSYVANIGYEKKDDAKRRQGWQMIRKNIDRIADLVANLLTYAKERTPEHIQCNPNDVVKEVCELMRERALNNDVRLTCSCDNSIKEVLIDPKTVHHSLINLISNAIDACIFDEDAGKKYRVQVKLKLEKENVIRFDVKDNGCGMNDEVKKNLFTSFFSTKMGEGTGLGMLVTKKLVEEHNGSILFSSVEKKGSIFTLKLPFETKPVKPAPRSKKKKR